MHLFIEYLIDQYKKNDSQTSGSVDTQSHCNYSDNYYGDQLCQLPHAEKQKV